MSKNLIARIAVAVVAIPAILWICYQGGNWLFGMVTLFATIGMIEYLIAEGFRWRSFGFWSGLVSFALVYLSLVNEDVVTRLFGSVLDKPYLVLDSFAPVTFWLLIFFFIGGMLFAIGKQPPAELFTRHARLLWGIVYLGMLYPFVYMLSVMLDNQWVYQISGGDILLYLFGVLWVGDTAAMGLGSWLGKHKLAPAVSPNKSVEGFIGGILGALAVGVIMYFWKLDSLPWYHLLLMTLGCSIFGQLGDLVESMWKRSIGIKDSSALIPGHGGVLDRFDSLLFAAPFLTFYLAALIRQ